MVRLFGTCLYVRGVGFRESAAERDYLLSTERPLGEAEARATPPALGGLDLVETTSRGRAQKIGR